MKRELPSASSMIRLMLRAHRPHFGRQPKHLYIWRVGQEPMSKSFAPSARG
jgi:hypothetical protein